MTLFAPVGAYWTVKAEADSGKCTLSLSAFVVTHSDLPFFGSIYKTFLKNIFILGHLFHESVCISATLWTFVFLKHHRFCQTGIISSYNMVGLLLFFDEAGDITGPTYPKDIRISKTSQLRYWYLKEYNTYIIRNEGI